MLSMEALRHDLTLVLIGQQLLIALLFLKGQENRRARLIGALLMLGVVGYLLQLAQLEPEHSLGKFVARALAISVPYVLWEFAHAVFETRHAPPWLRALIYTVPAALTLSVTVVSADPALIGWLNVGHHLAGIGVALYMLWRVLREQADDLIAPRRRYRFLFVALIGVQVSAVLLVELIYGSLNQPPPLSLELLNLAMIAILTLALCLPLLTTNGEILWGVQSSVAANNLPERPADPTIERLLTHMQDGGYAETGLSIGKLAEHVGIPEHQLRRLINQRLGYRNFSEFLHSYRVPAAATMLTDPALARRPVLSIALDVGYASIGPFNRAFRRANGVTPTEYRRTQLADSERN